MSITSFDDIKKLSPQVKIIAVGIIFLILGFLYWSYFLSSKLEARKNLKTKYEELTQKVNEKQLIANQKQKYIKEVAALKQKFELAMAKLPEKKDMPFLLYDIALAGKNAGVESVLFEPVAAKAADDKDGKAGGKAGDKGADNKQGTAKGNEQKPETDKKPDGKAAEGEKFYEEIPVKMTVVGRFHNTVQFFEKMANLPRIVNIEDIVMEESKDAKGKGRILSTACTIKTYMFLEKKDEQSKKTNK
jgi:type IV pilus assembly protein PilO